MAGQPKRSISLPPALDEAIAAAARLRGVSVSAWIAQTAEHRLALEAGWEALEDWEADHGRLTAEELAEGRRRAAESLAKAGRAARSPR